MAYIPSECSIEEYENQIYSGESKHRLYIKHGNTIVENASPFASKLVWKRRILANGSSSFYLNNLVSQEIDLILHDYEIGNLEEELEIKIGTYIDSVEDYVFIPLGIYKIQDNPTKNQRATTYKLRDRSVNFDFKYDGKPLIDNSDKVDENGNNYVTKLEILLDICEKANVEYVGSQTFIGYDDKIGIYDNTINARKYVAYLFEQARMFCFINRQGQLDSINIKDLVTRNINSNLLESFTKGDTYKISKVIYESGTFKFENGTDEFDNLYIDGANPYITKQEDIDRLSDVIGFEIDSFTTGKVLGNPTIDPYDLIETTYNDIIYKTLAQYTFTFMGTMTSKYDTTIKYEAKKTNITKDTETTWKKSITQSINNIDAELTIQAETIGENASDIASLKVSSSNINISLTNQKTEIDEIKQNQNNFEDRQNNIQTNIDGIQSEVSTMSGTITNMNYNFTTEALRISSSISKINALFNNTGVKVYNYEKLTSIFSDRGSGFDKLIVTGTAQIGYLKFAKNFKNNKKCTTIYHLNNLIEDLEDLESD